MTPPQKRYRCRSCGRALPAWLPVMQAPDGPMLLHHPSASHPDEVGPYLDRTNMAKTSWVIVACGDVV